MRKYYFTITILRWLRLQLHFTIRQWFTITISVPFGITKYFVHNLCSISIKVNLAPSQSQTGLAVIAVLTVSTLNFYGSVLILEYPLTSERLQKPTDRPKLFNQLLKPSEVETEHKLGHFSNTIMNILGYIFYEILSNLQDFQSRNYKSCTYH